MNQIRIGAVLSYVSMGLSTVISLVYTPIMVNNLGKGEYGVYSTVIPIISYLTLLSLGLGSAYVRYYSRAKVAQDKKEMAKLNGMFLITYTVLGLVLLGLGVALSLKGELVFGNKWTPDQLALGGKLLRIMSLTAALSFPFSVFESHVTIHERYLFQKILLMAKQVLNPLLTIPLLLLGFRSEAVALMSLFFTVLSGVLNIYYCFAKLRMPVSFRHYDFGLMREMVGFTVWVFIGIVVDNINWGIGQLMMNWQHGAEAAAVYNLSNQLNTYYLAFATAVANVLTPRVHRMVASHAKKLGTEQAVHESGADPVYRDDDGFAWLCGSRPGIYGGLGTERRHDHRLYCDTAAICLYADSGHPNGGIGDSARQEYAQVPFRILPDRGGGQCAADDPHVQMVGRHRRGRVHFVHHAGGQRAADELVLQMAHPYQYPAVLEEDLPAIAVYDPAAAGGGGHCGVCRCAGVFPDPDLGMRVRGSLLPEPVAVRHESL